MTRSCRQGAACKLGRGDGIEKTMEEGGQTKGFVVCVGASVHDGSNQPSTPARRTHATVTNHGQAADNQTDRFAGFACHQP